MKTVLLIVAISSGLAAAGTQPAAELTKQATELYVQSRYMEAEPVYRRAIQAWTDAGPEGRQDRALAMRDLGSVLRVLGRYDEAETLLKQSLADLDSSQPKVRALWNLATLYRIRGEYPEAERYALRAIETADANDQLGPKLVLSSVYIEERRYEEAIPILLDLEHGAEDALRVAIDNNLATIALAQADYPKAEQYARKALDAGRNSLPANHPAIAAAWNSLGQACRFQGRYLDAERSYRESIARWERTFGPSHPDVAKVMMNLAALYHQRQREAGAEDLYSRAAQILEASGGQDGLSSLVARNELADVLRGERRYTESAKLGRASLQLLEKSLPPGDPRLADALANRVKLLRETGHAAEAQQLMARISRGQPVATTPQTAVPVEAGRTTGALLSR